MRREEPHALRQRRRDGRAGPRHGLKKSLRILFPAVFDGTANEPQIVKTDVNVHEEAWLCLKKGATANGVTNKSVFDWSASPLAGKKSYLVGDAWYPLGSGWANAAHISSICVLDEHFGMKLASHELSPVIAISRPRTAGCRGYGSSGRCPRGRRRAGASCRTA